LDVCYGYGTRRPDRQSIPFEPTELFLFNKGTLSLAHRQQWESKSASFCAFYCVGYESVRFLRYRLTRAFIALHSWCSDAGISSVSGWHHAFPSSDASALEPFSPAIEFLSRGFLDDPI
jgi:hypothetical protein